MGLVAPRCVGSSQIRDWTCVSCIDRHVLYHWVAREDPWLWFFTVKGSKAKSAQGKGTWGEFYWKPGARFQESLLEESDRVCLTPLTLNCDMCEMLLSRKAHQFYWGKWHRYSLPPTYWNSRLPEGNHVFRINCIIFTDSLLPLRESFIPVQGTVYNSSLPLPAVVGWMRAPL